MDVNRTNYEEYILDYLEGGLDGEAYNQMHGFLEENPTIQAEVKDLLNYRLPKEEVTYNYKASLHKSGRKFSLPSMGIGFASGIAASFLLVAGFMYFFQTNEVPTISQTEEIQTNHPVIAATDQEAAPIIDEEETVVNEELASPKKEKVIEKKKVVKPQLYTNNTVTTVRRADKLASPRSPIDNSTPVVSSLDEFLPVEEKVKLAPVEKAVFPNYTASVSHDGHDHEVYDNQYLHTEIHGIHDAIVEAPRPRENHTNVYYYEGFQPENTQQVYDAISFAPAITTAEASSLLIDEPVTQERELDNSFLPKSIKISIKKKIRDKKSK